MNEARVALAQLFRATGEAHHHAFAVTNGDDPDWPGVDAEGGEPAKRI